MNWLLCDTHRDLSPSVTEVRQTILFRQSSATPVHTKIVSLQAIMHHFSTLQRKATYNYTSPRDTENCLPTKSFAGMNKLINVLIISAYCPLLESCFTKILEFDSDQCVGVEKKQTINKNPHTHLSVF